MPRFDTTTVRLPPECEAPLLERFLKAEAMALWAVRSARLQQVPPNVLTFLRRHEEDEQEHLKQFESMVGHPAHGRERLPTVPRQWPALAVQLYGYEALGLEFARLLAALRPDLASIVKDEEAHVGFFEREILNLLTGDERAAGQARVSAGAWWRKLPRTLDRYLEGEALSPFKSRLSTLILTALEQRFVDTGLLDAVAQPADGSPTPPGPGDPRPLPSDDISGRVEPGVGRGTDP